jgi:kumamolisin
MATSGTESSGAHADASVDVPNTHRDPWPGAQRSGAVDAEREIALTIWLRPKSGGAIDPTLVESIGRTPPRARSYRTRSELREQTDADEAERNAVEAFCRAQGMKVSRAAWRCVVVSGPLGQLISVFGAEVDLYLDFNGHHFRHRRGPVRLPQSIARYVRGVFGFHQWPHSTRIAPHPTGVTPPLTAADIAAHYGFRGGADGTGQTIGVLQLGGTFRVDDFRACMQWQGGSSTDPVEHRIDDAETQRETQTSKDIELALDTQIVGTLAPGAKIVIYDAPNDERGFLDAIRDAVFDATHAPSVLSISFGWSEHVWTPVALELLSELTAAAALIGVTILCSSGDEGAHPDPQDGKLHTEAPACVPFVLACGGTVLDPASATETGWSNSSGGFSRHFSVPAWQTVAADEAGRVQQRAGRGVPDVSAQQQPGYPIVFDGAHHCALGTSAVAPMWAALIARVNERLGVNAGFFAPLLYANGAAAHRDVLAGNNGAFDAHAGWNPVTGLGVPDATALEAVLRAG